MAKRGRPSKDTPELREDILNQISEGKPLRQICREKSMAYSIVYDWMKKDPEFSERFAQAREIGFDCLAEELLEIIKTPLPMESVIKSYEGDKDKENKGPRSTTVKIEDNVHRSRLIAEYTFKLLSKWYPTKYGENRKEEKQQEQLWQNVLAE